MLHRSDSFGHGSFEIVTQMFGCSQGVSMGKGQVALNLKNRQHRCQSLYLLTAEAAARSKKGQGLN